MNSTITIEDTDEEVIDLEPSQDTFSDASNGQSERFTEKNSLSNNIANRTDAISENTEYKTTASTSQTCDNTIYTSKPLFKVMFRNESISRQYSKQIKEFLEDLISSTVRSQESNDSLTLEIWDNDTDSTSQSVETITKSEDSQNIICDTMFIVDTQPKLKDDLDVPTYGKKYENAFKNNNPEQILEQENQHLRKMKCFNCLGNHNLRDCSQPRFQANINQNRKYFRVKGNSKTVRYHLDDDQKFGHIIPGQLSSSLRKALGLKDYELPKHIYRMRTLGYPPGWLEEARLQHSGLTLFNSDGVAENDPNDEPGEIFADGDRDQYDMKKIYDFPGFNVPPPPGTHDEYGQYWVSQMQVAHSKETMLLLLKGKQADDGYKRKKLKITNTELKDSLAPESTAMEIEDIEESIVKCIPINGFFVPPLPRKSILKPPKPPLPALQPPSEDSDYHSQELQFSETLDNSASPSSRTNSPSLFDLENMKKRLLVELQESSSHSNPDISKNNSSTSKSDMPPPSNEVTPESNRTRRSTLNTSCGSIKSVDLGTPVLQSASPYSKLPSAEKFSKDICNVINFENLPDSTGKYEQMTGVLQKVRNKLAQFQQE